MIGISQCHHKSEGVWPGSGGLASTINSLGVLNDASSQEMKILSGVKPFNQAELGWLTFLFLDCVLIL